jgi:hypothetical protein
VYLPMVSIGDGTWASGPPPDEFVEADMCYEFKIAPSEWERMSAWRRRSFFDYLQSRREGERRANESSKAPQQGGGGRA